MTQTVAADIGIAVKMNPAPALTRVCPGVGAQESVEGGRRERGPLLHVLDLFPELLAEHLGVEHGACHGGVASLGAEGVELARDLLHQEVEPFADRAVLLHHQPEVLQVGAQPVQLLGDVRALDQNGHLLHQTLNVMTLGGMALAVGILVDDATVELENVHRNLHQRKRLVQAILDGASQIAVPAFVSTICICVVFVPVVFISGAAK